MNEFEMLEGLLKISWTDAIDVNVSQPEEAEDQSFIMTITVTVPKETGHLEYNPELIPPPSSV